MPAQKRSSEDLGEESPPEEEFPAGEEEGEDDGEVEEDGEAEDEDEQEDDDDDDDGEEEEKEDSDGSRSSEDEVREALVAIQLADFRKEVQCPICLGIIKKTRTVMECLHRFCRECIDKSMRMGNNECPACRTHCASRRSLRDDPNFDAIIATLYQDIDNYEAEELAFREEEKTRNKQIQASIAETHQRQTEALGRKRTTAKAVTTVYRRSRGRRRGRGGRNSRAIHLHESEDDEDVNFNEEIRDTSSADEHGVNVNPRRRRRRYGQRFSQPSAVEADGGCDENNDLEASRENIVASPGHTSTPDLLAWGRGGFRSQTRYGSVLGNSKSGRHNRIAKLVDHLQNSRNNVDRFDVQLILVPVDTQTTPRLEEPLLCCNPTICIGQLCQFVAFQTPLQPEDVEILVVKDPHFSPSTSSDDPVPSVDFNKDNLQLVEERETLGELLKNCYFSGSNMVMAYRQKVSS